MTKVKIVTDSTCDLPPEVLSAHAITVVPLYVRFGEEIYADGVNLNGPLVFQKVKETNLMPQTAAPTPEDFQQAFARHLAAGYDVVCICLSSHLSATVQSATIAAGECPPKRVEIIDGLNLSAATGLLVRYAAELAETGFSAAQVAARVRQQIAQAKVYFMVDNMEYLYKGGRCSAIQHVMAGMLKIHPVLTVEAGQIIVAEKVRGGEKKMLERMMDYLLADKEALDPRYIAVAGAACPAMVEMLLRRIKEELPEARIMVTEAGSVISSHCGPGTFGLFYLYKE